MMENTFRNRAEVFTFFLELYAELKKSYTLVDTGKDTYAGIYNVFLIVTPKAIYGVSNNLSVHEYERYAAQGAGADYSLGCLYGVYDTTNDAFELTRLPLEASCHFSIYCKEPLDIIEVKASDFGKLTKGGYKAHGTALKTVTKRRHPVTSARTTTKTKTSKPPSSRTKTKTQTRTRTAAKAKTRAKSRSKK
jgi:hypothetical protein